MVLATIAGPSRKMSSRAIDAAPVRLVLFDVFDTLCTPRLPIHEQYYEEAIRAGIPATSISASSVRAGFRPAFKKVSNDFPLYGKKAKPHAMSPEEWWTRLIRSCMAHAGASHEDLDRSMPSLAPRLLQRFESEEGYRNFSDTLPCLEKLKAMGIKTSVVSNADPRILKTLDALHILSLLSYPPILSWDVENSKPDRRIYDHALESCGETDRKGVLMVGDELEADYRGARAAGVAARLIRRQGEWSDGAARASDESLEDVEVVRSLYDIIDHIEERNNVS